MPTSIPPIEGQCRRSPSGDSASTPTSQNGCRLANKDAIPLGIHCSLYAKAPVPIAIVSNP